ncbi:zinc-binding alcohol dehydrogenase family protein [Metabacillus arenae]|uniref:Zinc-binding alcohol dehydrogenase family protein n=1 Tax=Metabacillus arenae TaxID=2771434 RepID=A0A926NI27_9BACI|nr:zinc-binding alcohol dehydrogenase family protein [Metabacillus arenae]MBD1381445.1 zinc-binding alcohol dehydrogenase family protein [Metabacillus arenae]
MKAVKVINPGDFQVVEETKPEIERPNEVLLKIKMVGICGSDLHIIHGTNPLATYPRIIGHEVTGEIEAAGNDVKTFKIGDKAVLEPIISCGECYACRKGRKNVCEKLQVFGVHIEGGLQEYLVVPENLLHKVDSDLAWEEAVTVEPFTIGAQANWRGNVQEGETVLIHGAGPIGLCCLKIAKLLGAKVMITDLNEERLAFAQKWGADEIVNVSGKNIIEEVKRWTEGEGVNVVIDAVCIPQTFEVSIEAASAAGTIVLLGFDTRPSSIPQLPITKKELTIVGSRLQTNQFPKVIEWMNNKKLLTDGLITHTFAIDEMKEAIRFIENYPEEVRKAVICF